jgi:ribonuclease J
MTRDFVVKAKEAEPVAIVCEATNMTGASISSEAEVEGKLDDIVRQLEGIALAEFAYADIDRLNSFFRIAKTNDRCLGVSLRQAYLLYTLRADKHLNVPDLKDPSILIFRKSKVTNCKWEKQIMQEYAGKGKDAFEVSKQQCKTILTLSFYDFEEGVDIKPQAGSCCIVWSSEPFNEEMQIDFEKLVNWLKHYGRPQYHVHASGHVMPIQLRAIVEEINAQKTFPIHTEHPDLFARFVGDLKSKIVPTEKDVEYRI